MEKNDTKNKIITAAFKTLLEVPFSRLSLSDIARNAGITKPAIYRHFISKQDLLNRLSARFYDDLSAVFLKDFDCSCSAFDLFARSAEFFMSRPGYLNFFLLSMLYTDRIDEVVKHELLERGFSTDFLKSAGVHFESCFTQLGCLQYTYVVATGMFCTLFIHAHNQQAAVNDPSDFACRVAQLVFNGWKCVKPLPEARMAELEKIAAIDPAALPDIGRFGAVARVVKKYGFPETTIERIAAEIGIAKSSLYYHCKNKVDFFTNFLAGEIHFLEKELAVRLKYAQTLSESLYIFLFTITDYAVQREEILPVFGWMRHSGHIMPDMIEKNACSFYVFSGYPEYVPPELGIEISNTFILSWLHSLAISTVIQFCVHGFGAAAVGKQVRQLFSFIAGGVYAKDGQKS